MNEPTPRPWECDGKMLFEREPSGALIASCRDAANAAHIVRCVNCFDELLAAATEAREAIQTYQAMGRKSDRERLDLIAQTLKLAIAKAKEK